MSGRRTVFREEPLQRNVPHRKHHSAAAAARDSTAAACDSCSTSHQRRWSLIFRAMMTAALQEGLFVANPMAAVPAASVAEMNQPSSTSTAAVPPAEMNQPIFYPVAVVRPTPVAEMNQSVVNPAAEMNQPVVNPAAEMNQSVVNPVAVVCATLVAEMNQPISSTS